MEATTAAEAAAHDHVAADMAAAGAVIVDAYQKFDQCAMSYSPIAMVANFAIGEEEALAHWATMHKGNLLLVFLKLALGLVLLRYADRLVRPINFLAGAYLGLSFALLALKIFVKSMITCDEMVFIPLTAAFVAGTICAYRRSSMFGIIGMVLGEVLGRYLFNSLLRPMQVPEQLAYTCIGFFIVVMIWVSESLSDVAVASLCSLFGAFFVISATMQLFIIPLTSPELDLRLNAFVKFHWPDPKHLGHGHYNERYWAYLTSDPFIQIPLFLSFCLAVYGTCTQLSALRARREAEGASNSELGAFATQKAKVVAQQDDETLSCSSQPLSVATSSVAGGRKSAGRKITKVPTQGQVRASALQMK